MRYEYCNGCISLFRRVQDFTNPILPLIPSCKLDATPKDAKCKHSRGECSYCRKSMTGKGKFNPFTSPTKLKCDRLLCTMMYKILKQWR